MRMAPGEHERILSWFEDFVRAELRKKPDVLQKFDGGRFEDGQLFQVGRRQYLLSLREEPRAGHSARIRPATLPGQPKLIEMTVSSIAQPETLDKAIRQLLSRLVAADCLPEFTRRVLELNQLYFRQPIKGVKFKYASSRWGSCSSTGNLNFSTRLLFAPDETQDYVIIHELAHLIEHNHSDRFWKLVSDAMPDYQKHEKWLKQNGKRCDFLPQ